MGVATEVVEVILIVCGTGGLVASAGLGLASHLSRSRTRRDEYVGRDDSTGGGGRR